MKTVFMAKLKAEQTQETHATIHFQIHGIQKIHNSLKHGTTMV
jgi:hypothetical protein